MVISTSQAMLDINVTRGIRWYKLTSLCVCMRLIDDYQYTRRHIPEDRHIHVYSRLNCTAVAGLVF
jgi:hypothetical protein